LSQCKLDPSCGSVSVLPNPEDDMKADCLYSKSFQDDALPRLQMQEGATTYMKRMLARF